MLYVSVLEGDTPENTRSIFTTRDPDILRAVADAVSRKMAEGVECEGSPSRILGLVGDDEDQG